MLDLFQLRDEIVDETHGLVGCLRKCLVLAVQRNDENMQRWALQELKGYDNGDHLPEYRQSDAAAHGYFVGSGWAMLNDQPIPPSQIPAKYHQYTIQAKLTESISFIEKLAAKTKEGHGDFRAEWSSDLVALLGNKILEGWNLYRAYIIIPPSLLLQVVETVRTRLLLYVLDLIKADGILESAIGVNNCPPAHSANVSIINSSIGTFQLGTSNLKIAQQSVVVGKGDWVALKDVLLNQGASETDCDDLKSALEQDLKLSGEEVKIGSETQTWLTKFKNFGQRTIQGVSQGVAIQIIVNAIMGYLGK